MINGGRDYLLSAWWISVITGIALTLTVLTVCLIGDWLRDALDPRLRATQARQAKKRREAAPRQHNVVRRHVTNTPRCRRRYMRSCCRAKAVSFARESTSSLR